MLGNFQQSQLRIEVEASETAIRDSLLRPASATMALAPTFAAGMPEQLDQGLAFTSWTGPSLFIIKWRWRHPTVYVYSVKELTGFTNGTGEKLGAISPGRSVNTAVEFGSNAQFAASASVLTAH